MIQAADGSIEERARFLSGAASRIPAFAPLPAASLGRVFGRERAVHVAVSPGRLAELIIVEAGRLAGLNESHSPGLERKGPEGLNFLLADANGSEMNKQACE